MREINIALAQLRCELGNKELNLLRILQSLEEASRKGADYVLFPELFLTGYVIDERLVQLAETVEGPSINSIRERAKRYRIGAVVGFPEKDGDRLYNSAILIGKNGEMIGKYRKVHLYHKEKDWFTAGDEFPIVHLPEGKTGLLITYDMEFPEPARIMALKGARLLLVLAANMVPYQGFQDIFIKARALENHIFTALANMVGLDNENVFFGESQVVHPNGQAIYKGKNNEELPIITLNIEETIPEEKMLDYLGNRRTSVYRSEDMY
ncbi:carbon-nitrogen hydrolase family protein [Siminovitchia sp. 179-K 8D1 HS]|uniref:carbon-nitrogen hydrolase family protein n=1 Tax=Siminovitchia sp. 179-K 8D1 HS TaxID=3142385 RepID=UPI0039A204E6